MELNDSINTLLSAKEKWEARILSLGGPNYKSANESVQTFSVEGAGLEEVSGYKYFGAAKNLKSVKEAFAKEVPQAPTEQKVNLAKVLDFHYLGYTQKD